MTTVEQLHQALEEWLQAHTDATGAAARYLEVRSVVGSNESERKVQRLRLPEDEYAAYAAQLNGLEQDKTAATATEERAEKVVNVLRELLNHETAETNRASAELAARTADTYAGLSMAPPARPIVVHKPVIDDSDLPF